MEKTYVGVTVKFPACTAAATSSGSRLRHTRHCRFRFHIDRRRADRKSAERGTISGKIEATKTCSVRRFYAAGVVPGSGAAAAASSSLEGRQHPVRGRREAGVGTVLVVSRGLMVRDIQMIGGAVEVRIVVVGTVVTWNAGCGNWIVEHRLMRQ